MYSETRIVIWTSLFEIEVELLMLSSERFLRQVSGHTRCITAQTDAQARVTCTFRCEPTASHGSPSQAKIMLPPVDD